MLINPVNENAMLFVSYQVFLCGCVASTIIKSNFYRLYKDWLCFKNCSIVSITLRMIYQFFVTIKSKITESKMKFGV